MDYLNNYILFKLNESILDVIENIFKESPKKTKNKLIKIIDDIKNNYNHIKKEDIDKILKNVEDKIGKVLYDLNFDSFVRGLYNISLNPNTNKEMIDDYIESYKKSIDNRFKKFKKQKFSNDEEFEEMKKIKKDVILKLSKKQYESELRPLQVELLKMQEWVKSTKSKVLIIFEGRDAAGKGSTINTITEYLDPKYYKISTFGIPTEEENKKWFLRYEKELPKPGTISFFDRSWYNRAVNDPVMGYCDENQYKDFMNNVNDFENSLIDSGFIIIKLWFSIDPVTQKLRFKIRKTSPLKYWKYSVNDEKSLSKWDVFTKYKEQMFRKTSTKKSPWIVVDSNDQRIARLNTMNYTLAKD